MNIKEMKLWFKGFGLGVVTSGGNIQMTPAQWAALTRAIEGLEEESPPKQGGGAVDAPVVTPISDVLKKALEEERKRREKSEKDLPTYPWDFPEPYKGPQKHWLEPKKDQPHFRGLNGDIRDFVGFVIH
jgi:hypothetical protein